MTAYRYVAFPPKAAPTAEELAAFESYADLLERHVAYGKQRGDIGLAIACEAEPFDRLRGLDPAFEELLLKWLVRGAQVVESLPFVKDGRPWTKIATHPKEAPPTLKSQAESNPAAPPERSPEQHVRDGKEAIGLGRLEAAKTIARGEAYQRWGERLPYVLWALAAAATLLVGAYLGDQLLAGEGERRSDTVERVLQDPLGERLDAKKGRWSHSPGGILCRNPCDEPPFSTPIGPLLDTAVGSISFVVSVSTPSPTPNLACQCSVRPEPKSYPSAPAPPARRPPLGVLSETGPAEQGFPPGESALFASKKFASLTVRCCLLLAMVSGFSASVSAQEVRFLTNVGSFLVTLNPTANDGLQPLVNNFLEYVESGRYDNTWINRAQANFVVQMGSFVDPGVDANSITSGDVVAIDRFDPVIVDADNDGMIDFDTTGLSNTRGTISLALSGSPNSGSSSFFVNLGDNSGLDSQGFVPFATIDDLAVIDAINALQRVSLDSTLTFSDVPVLEDDRFVVIERAFVIPEPTAAALAAGCVLLPFGLTRRRV